MEDGPVSWPSWLPDMQDPMTAKQAYIIVVSLVSVLLWCLNSILERWLGQMGIIAILPMVAFYGFGILNKAGPLVHYQWLTCAMLCASCTAFCS